MRIATIIACLVCAVAAMCLAFNTYTQVALAGFPDGHVTDYAKAVDVPLTVIAWAEAGFGFVFLVLAFLSRRAARAIWWLLAMIALVVVAIVAHVVVPWYFGTHLGLDNGIGG